MIGNRFSAAECAAAFVHAHSEAAKQGPAIVARAMSRRLYLAALHEGEDDKADETQPMAMAIH